MSQNLPTSSINRDDIKEKIIESVMDETPDHIIDIIADHIEKAETAKIRIAEEGIVVRDMKGSVIPHPAIKIESDANKFVSDLIFKYRSK